MTRPTRMFFNTDRSYTMSEVNDMVSIYGTRIVIGGNTENEGHLDIMRLVKSKGALTHYYFMGRGAEPDSEQARTFPGDPEQRERHCNDIGMTTEEWFAGGWQYWHHAQLLKYKKQSMLPYSVEWDSTNILDIGKIIQKFYEFTQKESLDIKFMAKNLEPIHLEIVKDCIRKNYFPMSILAPFGVLEPYLDAEDRVNAKTEALTLGILYTDIDDGTGNVNCYQTPKGGIECFQNIRSLLI